MKSWEAAALRSDAKKCLYLPPNGLAQVKVYGVALTTPRELYTSQASEACGVQ